MRAGAGVRAGAGAAAVAVAEAVGLLVPTVVPVQAAVGDGPKTKHTRVKQTRHTWSGQKPAPARSRSRRVAAGSGKTSAATRATSSEAKQRKAWAEAAERCEK